ncbi:MAG: DNA-binding protein [Archaeoglobaceae archaeon]
MDDDLEELKKKRLKQMQEQGQQEQELQKQQEQQQEYEEKKKQILRSILDSEARERLGRIRIAHPELVENVEQQLLMLAQSGRLNQKITDDMLIQILKKVTPKKRETSIRRK